MYRFDSANIHTSMGGVITMTSAQTGLCEECNQSFCGDNELLYLYCGHNQELAYRICNGCVDHLHVESTSEAIQIIRDADELLEVMAT